MMKNGLMVLFTLIIFLFQCSLPPALLSWNLDTVSKLGGIAWSAGEYYVHHELIHYGNWYGAGYWGGSWDPDKPGDKPPVDSLDEIAMRHDMAYWIAEELGRKYGAGEEQRIKAIADAIAAREAMALDPDPKKWDLPPSDPKAASVYAGRIKWIAGNAAPVRSNFGDAWNWTKSWVVNQNNITQQEVQNLVDQRVKEWHAAHPQEGVAISDSAVSGQDQSEGSGSEGQILTNEAYVSGSEGQILTNEAYVSGSEGWILTNEAYISDSEGSVPGGATGQGQSGVPLVIPGSSGPQTDKYGSGKTSKDWDNVQENWDEVQPGWDKVQPGWDKVY